MYYQYGSVQQSAYGSKLSQPKQAHKLKRVGQLLNGFITKPSQRLDEPVCHLDQYICVCFSSCEKHRNNNNYSNTIIVIIYLIRYSFSLVTYQHLASERGYHPWKKTNTVKAVFIYQIDQNSEIEIGPIRKFFSHPDLFYIFYPSK